MLWAAISRFPYAVALKQPLALSLVGSADSSDDESARVEIEKLFTLACVFRDHEFLSRFGRIYKDKGDRLLGENMSHQEFLNRRPPSFRHYLAALHRILPEETGTIVGIHKQLRRLQWALGADIV